MDQAGIDLLLVGDSAAMVVHGHDNTLPITTDEMLTHCKAVARGASRPFLIGDLPFGTYEVSPTQAVATAVRFLKEGCMDAVKLEGAFSPSVLSFLLCTYEVSPSQAVATAVRFLKEGCMDAVKLEGAFSLSALSCTVVSRQRGRYNRDTASRPAWPAR